MPHISIIIPTYRRAALLKANLEPLFELINANGFNIEVIIVNDFKGDNDTLLLDSELREYIVNNPKQGVSSARNFGASKAKSKFIIFMDDDIIPTKEVIESTFLFFEQYDQYYVFNPDWVYPPELNKKASRSTFGRFLLFRELNTLKGWMGKDSMWVPNTEIVVPKAASYFLAINRETLNAIGGYNEDFPYAGFEDGEFADRLRANGITTILDTRVKVYHNEEDRVDLRTWLQRKYREGITRKVSVKLGNIHYQIKPNSSKKIVFNLLFYLRSVLIVLIKLLNSKFFDSMLFQLINGLEGAHIWKGYSAREK